MSSLATGPASGGWGTARHQGTAADGAVVETVTVAVPECAPSDVREAGATEQVDSAGAPVQLRDTA